MTNQWAEWATYISMYSVIVPVIIAVLRYKHFNDVQRLIGLLVGITLIGEFIFYVLTIFEVRNLPAVHFFTAIQFIVLVLTLGRGLIPLFSMKFLKGLIFVFLIFVVCDACIFNGLNNFNSYSRPLASLILIFLSLCFFHKVLKELKIESLDNEPLFWINIGVLIYFSGNLFIFLFTNYIKASNDALFTIWGIHAIFNIILNISYSIALWIRPPN